jgi:hypothetical protein
MCWPQPTRNANQVPFLLAFWTALEVGWVLLDRRVIANAARDAIMPEVRLVVLEAEVLRLRALQAAQEIA